MGLGRLMKIHSVPHYILFLVALGGASISEVFAQDWGNYTPSVRYYIDAPEAVADERPDHIAFYALPNGNSIEWTYGAGGALTEAEVLAAREAGNEPAPDKLDWHYDIQHIHAQTLYLRDLMKDEMDLWVVYLEADPKSWPTWRRTHGDDGIPAMYEEIASSTGAAADGTWTLTGHSGGGSLSFGYMNAVEEITPRITRIAFLDSNYAYDTEDGHADKLVAWLTADPQNSLVVLAYDDREITYNGKKIVSATGGTYRATLRRMLPAFTKKMRLRIQRVTPWTIITDFGGQLDMRVHANPENKILHTVLVGEMNGFIHAMTVNTDYFDLEQLDAGRMYSEYIPSEPLQSATEQADQ